MNILIINHYAGSPQIGMEFRPYYFAREWIKMGHRVYIIAASYSHLRTINPIVKHDFETEIIDGIKYNWIKTICYKGNGIKRAITMFQFVSKLYLHTSQIAKEFKPDVVIASSTYPIDTYAAQRIAKKANARLVHEIHDMWPITPMEIGKISKYHPFSIFLQHAENSFCKNSDVVVSLLPDSKTYLIQHGLTPDKFVHISNGIVIDDWNNAQRLPEEHERILRELKNKNKFIICFFGSHTKSYALNYLIEAIHKVNDSKVAGVFVGDGTQKTELLEIAKKYDDNKIVFFSPIPKQSIPTLLEKVDAIYIGAIRSKIFQFGICMNKLFDSMMSGKPILYAVEAPNNYIDEYQCGITVEAENVEALTIAIKKMICMSKEELKIMGCNGKRAIIDHFDYTVLAKKFEIAIKK